MAAGTALQTSYCFSYMRRGKGGTNASTTAGASSKSGEESTSQPSAATAEGTTNNSNTPNPYESSIRTIATVSTVESFWEVYDYLKRPNDLPATTDYHFFRGGIKPTWEDPSNAKGGKWIVRLPKGLASRYWEEMILALIGGQLSTNNIPDGEICGAVLSVRYAEDILGVWNRTATDRDLVERIRDAIKKCLQLPPQANMEYKPHNDSLRDRTSFRNTHAWKPKSLEGRSTSVGEPSGVGVGGGSIPAVGSHGPGGGGRGDGGPPPSRRSTWASKGEQSGPRWRNPN